MSTPVHAPADVSPPDAPACSGCPSEPGTGRTSSQYLELVVEHNDLVVPLDAVETMNTKNLAGPTDQTVEEGEGRDRRGSPKESRMVKAAIEFCTPQTDKLPRSR